MRRSWLGGSSSDCNLMRSGYFAFMKTHRTTIDIEPELEKELKEAMALTREKQSTIIRLALRCGLPLVLNRFQAPAPEGTFAEAYKHDLDSRHKGEPAKV